MRQRRRATPVAPLTVRGAVRSLLLLVAVLAALVTAVSPPAAQAAARGARSVVAAGSAPVVGVPVSRQAGVRSTPRLPGVRFTTGRPHLVAPSAGTDPGGARHSSRLAPPDTDRLTEHLAGSPYVLTQRVAVPAPSAAAGRRRVTGTQPAGPAVVPASGRSPPVVAGLLRRQQMRSDHLDT